MIPTSAFVVLEMIDSYSAMTSHKPSCHNTLITDRSIIVNHRLSFTATNEKSRSFVVETHLTRDVSDMAYHQLHVPTRESTTL